MMKFVMVAVALLLLTGCAGGRFAGLNKCMPDGSVVWYQYQNASGTYDGAKAKPENCLPS